MARWAASSSPTPTRTPAARMVAASSVSLPVSRAPRRSRTLEHPSLAHLLDVLPNLEHHAEGGLEVPVVERQQRLGPGDRLAHPGQLVEILSAQAGDSGADPLGDLVRDA